MLVAPVIQQNQWFFADTILKKYSSTIATIFTGVASAVLFGHTLTINFILGISIVIISMHQVTLSFLYCLNSVTFPYCNILVSYCLFSIFLTELRTKSQAPKLRWQMLMITGLAFLWISILSSILPTSGDIPCFLFSHCKLDEVHFILLSGCAILFITQLVWWCSAN